MVQSRLPRAVAAACGGVRCGAAGGLLAFHPDVACGVATRAPEVAPVDLQPTPRLIHQLLDPATKLKVRVLWQTAATSSEQHEVSSLDTPFQLSSIAKNAGEAETRHVYACGDAQCSRWPNDRDHEPGSHHRCSKPEVRSVIRGRGLDPPRGAALTSASS